MGANRLGSLAVLLFLLLSAVFPQAAKAGVLAGLRLSAGSLIPALFPFSVGVGILVRTGFGAQPGRGTERFLNRCFGLPGGAFLPLALGFLGGYPLGAQILADQVRAGALSRRDGIRLSAFCCNAGPGFLLGAVGPVVLRAPALGAALLLIHIGAALLTGLLLREPGMPGKRREGRSVPAVSLPAALPEAVFTAAVGMVRLTGSVVLFSVLDRLLAAPLTLLPDGARSLLRGFLELSGGVLSLQTASLPTAFLGSAVLLGWGGLCVHLQAAQFFGPAGIPMGLYLTGKALHALLSGALAELFLLFTGLSRPAEPSLLIPAAAAFPLFFLFFLILRKIHWKNGKSML